MIGINEKPKVVVRLGLTEQSVFQIVHQGNTSSSLKNQGNRNVLGHKGVPMRQHLAEEGRLGHLAVTGPLGARDWTRNTGLVPKGPWISS